MNKYPTYKPSNIDWIGEIPSHWMNRKIAWSFSQIGSGTTPKSDSDEYYENGTINWLLTGDLNDGEITKTSKKITELAIKENSTLKMYPKDSIVIAMYGATIGKLGILKIETTTNQACCVMAKSTFFHYKYVFYWLLSSRESIINLGYGGGQPNINQDLVKSLRVTQPSLSEQQAIVAYLDEKTTLIDELIDKKERKIELLKEQRAALINQAVTKGLNAEVAFKDSGIEWIGEIPEHWEKRKIAWSFEKIGSGTTPKSDSDLYYENGTINWLLTGDLNDGEITETSKKITELAIKDNPTLKMYPKDSIVIAMYGATIGKLGLLKIETTTNQACCVMAKSSFFNYKYVFYWLLSGRESIINLGYGGGQPNINQDLVKSLRITLPPLSEQQAIVAYLDEQTALIDKSIEIESQKIEKLKEYRQSLISNVVTGKIKVV